MYMDVVFVETIVGVNKFKLEHEPPIEVRVVDNTKVRESQIRKINKMKQTRDSGAVSYL